MNLGSVFAGAAPALGALAGSAFGSAGSVLGGSIGQGIGSAYQVQQLMDFQRDMSNTAYQRRAADLQAAGLNPVLAVSSGSAGVPGGGMGQVPQSPGMEMSTAKDVSRKVAADADAAQQDALGAGFQANILKTQDMERMQRLSAAQRYGVFNAQAAADYEAARNDAAFERQWGPTARVLRGVAGPGLSAVSSAVDVGSSLVPAGRGVKALGAVSSSARGVGLQAPTFVPSRDARKLFQSMPETP